MKNTVIIGTAILGLLFSSVSSLAQEINCGENYDLALAQYNYGLADSALSILEPCLLNQRIHKELTRGESGNIYRLAALASILIGNSGDAEKYIKELLKYQPNYADNWREGDLLEFRYMIEGTRSQPSFKLGLRGGINFPLLSLQKNYSEPEKPDANFSLEGKTGFQFGILSETAISRNLALEAGLGLQGVSFNYWVQGSGFEEYLYEQEITYIEIPVLLKYYLPVNSALKPYVQAGLTGRFSLYLREDSEEFGKYWLTESAGGDYFLATFMTDLENMGIDLGAGISYDLKDFSIRADIRYSYHPPVKSKLAKFDKIQDYEDIPPSEAFGYTHDINLITLSDLQITLGLAYNLKYKVF